MIGDSGGSIALTSAGNLLIDNCSFFNGSATYGGFIVGQDLVDVAIRNSVFLNGEVSLFLI